MKLFTILVTLIPLLVFPAAAQSLAEIMSQRSSWPRQITTTADVSATLFTSEGKQVGKQPISKGKTMTLHGVYKQGVAVRVGKMIAFMPPSSTDIVSGIKETREAKALASAAVGNGGFGATAATAAAAPTGPKLSAGMASAIPRDLMDSGGKKRTHNELAGKYVGIYFSAHWCGPCRAFTPSLVEFRDRNADKFEVVFVSSDRSLSDQKSYMRGSNMEWLATKHGSDEEGTLKRTYAVRGIPKLIILDPDGKVVSENGRGEISSLGDKAFDRWK